MRLPSLATVVSPYPFPLCVCSCALRLQLFDPSCEGLAPPGGSVVRRRICPALPTPFSVNKNNAAIWWQPCNR